MVQALGSRGLQLLVCRSKGIRKAQPLPEIWGCREQGWHQSALCLQGHAALCSNGASVQVCTTCAPCQPTGHLSWLTPAACSLESTVLSACWFATASHSAGLGLLAWPMPWQRGFAKGHAMTGRHSGQYRKLYFQGSTLVRTSWSVPLQSSVNHTTSLLRSWYRMEPSSAGKHPS